MACAHVVGGGGKRGEEKRRLGGCEGFGILVGFNPKAVLQFCMRNFGYSISYFQVD